MNAMEGRRVRRLGRLERDRRRRALIPLRRDSTTSSTRSWTDCCYCDYKIYGLNQPLFRLGTRFAAFLRPWFSLGLGFALASLLSVSLILLFQLAVALRILHPNPSADLSASFLFGFSTVSAFGFSLADSVYLLLSTCISVAFHEFGHALAAASEGIQMDYVAVFLVFLFPGALVAFNYDALQALSPRATLRVYCAGIWHNAVCCVVCCLVLLLMPMLLFPWYQQVQSPMVLSVTSSSPLSSYLTPGDEIVSLDGIRITSAKEWREMTALLNQVALESTNNDAYVEGVVGLSIRKGYCVPDSVLEDSKNIAVAANQSGCADDSASFITIPCSDKSTRGYGHPERVELTHCLNPKRVVKFAKCSSNWMGTEFESESCKCAQDETCLSLIQTPGMIWVEVSYSRPYSPKCLQSGRQPLPDLRATSGAVEPDCGGTFVFVGDPVSMLSSVQLTSYRPRWEYASAYLPYVVEKILICTFYVSLTLALLNSLPVYFLDGESILEEALCHLTRLSPSKREKLLQMCLLVGTVISLLSFFRIFCLRFS